MRNIQEILGIIAGILALVGYIPYIFSIFLGKTRPNKATWIIWTVVGGLLAFSYMAEGDKHSIWLPLGYFFWTAHHRYFVFSLRLFRMDSS